MTDTTSFRILISVPSIPTLAPTYLLPNGSITTEKSLGALCTISPSTELFCGSKTAVGAPLGTPSALFAGVRPPDYAPKPHEEMGGKFETDGFSVDARTSKLVWMNNSLGNEIKFVYKSDEQSRTIRAVFKETSAYSVPAELAAVYD